MMGILAIVLLAEEILLNIKLPTAIQLVIILIVISKVVITKVVVLTVVVLTVES